MAFASTYYSTSITRFRRRARDDIQRELVKTRLMNLHESADWINHFLDRFWIIYEPVLSRTVVATVDQILSTNCPPFLDSLRMTSFTLGTKAPRIERVKTYPDTPDDIITMDWGLSFTPNDTSDMTAREIKTKVNPKIVLAVRVGKGIAAGNLRRYERMQNHLYSGGVFCFWVLLLGGVSLALVWMWHLGAPGSLRFLTPEQESDLQKALIAALGSSALTSYAKKLTRSPKG